MVTYVQEGVFLTFYYIINGLVHGSNGTFLPHFSC